MDVSNARVYEMPLIVLSAAPESFNRGANVNQNKILLHPTNEDSAPQQTYQRYKENRGDDKISSEKSSCPNCGELMPTKGKDPTVGHLLDGLWSVESAAVLNIRMKQRYVFALVCI